MNSDSNKILLEEEEEEGGGLGKGALSPSISTSTLTSTPTSSFFGDGPQLLVELKEQSSCDIY